MIGLSVYILADTYFISSGVGTTGLTALNLALPVYSLVNGIGLMLGIGGAARFMSAARCTGGRPRTRHFPPRWRRDLRSASPLPWWAFSSGIRSRCFFATTPSPLMTPRRT